MKPLLVTLAALVVTAAALWATNEKPAPPAEFTFISASEHNYLDPQRMSWSHDIRLANQLYEPLVSYDYGAGKVRPGVAERWDISDDGRVYTFHLRADARWSNGDPVTAHDFVYAWRRALLPDMAADYTQMLYVIEGGEAFFNWRGEQLKRYAAIREKAGGDSTPAAAEDAAAAVWSIAEQRFADTVGAVAVDDRTLVVTLRQPVPYFLELVAFATYFPVHRASVEDVTSLDPETGMVRTDPTYWSKAVSNGPYVIGERRFKRYVHLDANPHYWGAADVGPKSIRELLIEDPFAAWQAYRSGKADAWLTVPGSGVIADRLQRAGGDAVHRMQMAGTYFYNFNCLPELDGGRPNPLADPRVRRAMSMAIDRTALVTQVTKMNQPVARSYVPPYAVTGYDPPVQTAVLFDPKAARALLAEAGYPGGRGLDGLSILYNTGHGHEDAAQAIQKMWEAHLGVKVGLEGVPGKAFSTRLKSQGYTIARASWFGDYPDPNTWLEKMTTKDNNNDCKWSNERFDARVAEAATMPPGPGRMAKLREAEAILNEEQPMALLYHYVNLYVWDPDRVQHMGLNSWGRFRFENVNLKD